MADKGSKDTGKREQRKTQTHLKEKRKLKKEKKGGVGSATTP